MGLPVKIKHAGKSYDAEVDLDAPGESFKQVIFGLTGVEPGKVKVPVKGGMLKDDADMKRLGLKSGQIIMVIGAAGPLPQAPPKPIVFMEDMTDVELAEAVKFPVGLQNLGNTCYMNSTVQVLRSIPELQDALISYRDNLAGSQQDAALTASLRDLYSDMGKTTEGFPPVLFLNMLRQFAPQFAERSRTNGQFSQQDAQEAWSSILNAVRNNLTVNGNQQFVSQYLTGEFERTLKSEEASEEAPKVTKEKFLEIKCNISSTTNYMINGITEALEQDIEKNSETLGRSALYKEVSRVSRLPSYLTVNLVRFYWRRDINKKTKIMRKIKFPFDLDVIDLLTEDLKKKVLPVNEKLKEVDKDRRERVKIRKRAKIVKQEKEDMERGAIADKKAGIERDPALSVAAMAATASGSGAPEAAPEAADPPEAMLIDESYSTSAVAGSSKEVAAGELVDEPSKRAEESKMLHDLVNPELSKDVGANVTGMYELTGIVTHKGASADGGHYISFCRRPTDLEDPEKQEWYRFDDEKVSVVSREKITALEGGGEDHSAYILLYASKKLD